jgi:hypothetical protein
MSKDTLIIRVSGILTEQRLEELHKLFKTQLPDDQPFILIDESVEELDVLYGLNDEDDKPISYGEGIVRKATISKESVDNIINDIVRQIEDWRKSTSKYQINGIDYDELYQIVKILNDYKFMSASMFIDLNKVIAEHKRYQLNNKAVNPGKIEAGDVVKINHAMDQDGLSGIYAKVINVMLHEVDNHGDWLTLETRSWHGESRRCQARERHVELIAKGVK